MQRNEWLLIALLTIIMLIKGVLWSLAFPLWQGPDEDDHYAVIQFIAELGRLPDEGDELLPDEVTLSRVLADVGRLPYNPEQRQAFSPSPLGPGEAAFAELPPSSRATFDRQNVGKLMHATPLYYVVAAGVYRLFDGGDLLARAHIQRLFAVLVSSPIVIVAYLITRLLFPANAAMRLTIPTLVAFQPMMSQMAAVVSVDGFFFVSYSLLIYLSLRVFQRGLTWRSGLALGAVFAVGVLVKPTLNGFAPLIGLLVVYDLWRVGSGKDARGKDASGKDASGESARGKDARGKDARGKYASGMVAIFVMAAVIVPPLAWWMQRSYRLNQDLFYFNPVVKGHRILENPTYDYPFWSHMIDYYQSVWGGIFTTWWAHFGWLDTALPPWVYFLLRGLTFLAVAGLAYRLYRVWRSEGIEARPGRWRLGARPPLVVWLFLAAAVLLPVVMLQYYDLTFWWAFGNGRGLQGRYWLGTVVPMLIFFVAGFLTWVPSRHHAAAHNALRLGMVLLNVVSLLGYILPRYYL
jgi:hypothetical protein